MHPDQYAETAPGDAPARPSETEIALNSLQNVIEQLAMITSTLEPRLVSVLRPSSPEAVEKMADVPRDIPSSPLARLLDEETQKVARVIHVVEDVLRRAEA